MRAVEDELKRLRRSGLRRADAGSYPRLAALLKNAGTLRPGHDFADALADTIRIVVRTYSGNPNSRVVAEIYALHQTTVGLSPREALRVSVQRLRGRTDQKTMDAFRNSEQAKAIAFLSDVFEDGFSSPEIENHDAEQVEIPDELLVGVTDARLTRFYPSRDYYKRLRGGRESISEYVQLAHSCVEMVSISLPTGTDMEGVVDTFEELIQRREPVTVRISLLDPEMPALTDAIAPVVGASPETLRGRIRDTLTALEELRTSRLSRARRPCLEVWCHSCVPNASAILLDADSDHGLVQLETKGYKTGMKKSFGFEVAAGSEFFVTLRDSYRHLIADGRRIL